MECGAVRELADAFISNELPADAALDVRSHVEHCPSCWMDLEARRSWRGSLRGAFERAPELEARPDFADDLRARLRTSYDASRARRLRVYPWLALAATLVIAAGLIGAWLLQRQRAADEQLAATAVGDHRHCALRAIPRARPAMGGPVMSLEDAALRYDASYHVVEHVPADRSPLRHGAAEIVTRHSCVFDGTRFAHLIVRYGTHVVSVAIARRESLPFVARAAASLAAREHRMGDLSVISLHTDRYVVFVIGDLSDDDLAEFQDVVARPIAEQLRAL